MKITDFFLILHVTVPGKLGLWDLDLGRAELPVLDDVS